MGLQGVVFAFPQAEDPAPILDPVHARSRLCERGTHGPWGQRIAASAETSSANAFLGQSLHGRLGLGTWPTISVGRRFVLEP